MKDETKRSRIDLEAGRRAFLRTAGLAGAALTGAAALPTFGTTAAHAEPSDVDIFNFALNLEYLEAEYYLQAAFGRGLREDDTTGNFGRPGPVVGGSKVPFKTKAIREYAEEIAMDEEAHVQFIRFAIGEYAVARPKIDLKTSFTTAAIAAGLIDQGQTFDPFADEDSFLLGAFIFEDVGVTAYNGAAPLIQKKENLAAAASIMAVEAYHAGEIRTTLYQRGLFAETRAISDLRDAVDGGSDLDQPIRVKDKANIVPSDKNGLAFSRTPQQVLNIVYLGGKSGGFGFFPNKVNGAIR